MILIVFSQQVVHVDLTAVQPITPAPGDAAQHIPLAPGGTADRLLLPARGDAVQPITPAPGDAAQHIPLAPGGTADRLLLPARGDVVQHITLVLGIMEAVVIHILLVGIMEAVAGTHIPPVEVCTAGMVIVAKLIQRALVIMEDVAPHIIHVIGIVPALIMVDMEVVGNPDLEVHLLMLLQLYRRFDHK